MSQRIIKRLLILGFSLTEQHDDAGFAPRVATYLRDRFGTLDVDIRGIGGVHVDGLAYEFDSYVKMSDYDACILDLTTSTYRRGRLSTEAFAWPVAAILAKARAHGAATAMVHLWRSDVNFEGDMFIDVCERLGKAIGARSVNVAKAVAALPEAQRTAMFRDEVHTTAVGANFYAEQITPVALSLLEAQPLPLNPKFKHFATSTFSLPVVEMATKTNPRIYRRGGLALRACQILEGEQISLNLPQRSVFGGMSSIIGPYTGVFKIKVDSHAPFEFISYDQFAYYERLSAHVFTENWASTIHIEQLSGVSDVVLRKGEKQFGQRRGQVFNIFLSTASRKELAAQAIEMLY